MSQITKKAMAEALKHLLETRPLSKITITDITQSCSINRMTFYYHFQDIYDLIDWICQDEGERAIGENRDAATWQEGFLNLCRSVLENRSFIENVYHSVQREQIENFLYRVTEALIGPVVDEETAGNLLSEVERQWIIDFYKYALVGVAINWVKTDMKQSPEELTNILSTMLNGQIALAIQNFQSSGSTTKQPK